MTKEKIDKLLLCFLETSYLFEKSEEKLFNLSWQEIYLLQKLKIDGSMKIMDIAKVLLLQKYQTTRIINKMIKKKVLTKAQSKEDARVFNVSITMTGLKAIREIEDYHYLLFQNNENMISENQLALIEEIILKFRGKINNNHKTKNMEQKWSKIKK